MARRRKHIRAFAAVSVHEMAEGEVYRTRDISMGGMFILMNPPWEVGSQHSLVLTHQRNTLDVQAEVMSIAREGVGVRYVAPTPRFHTQLKRFLTALIFEDTETEEQRRSPRIVTTSLIAFMDQEGEFRGTARDMSRTGALILADRSPPLESSVYIYIPFFDTRSSREPSVTDLHGTQARVVRHSDGGFAVQFDSPSTEFRDAVDRVTAAAPKVRSPD